MAFGRLDVFFPDGMYETFLLTEPNTSIGRSPGNTIALDTETISRYHLSITQTDGQVFLTDLDSQNGTFVDGTRLKHNEPIQLRGGEEINIGELILIFHDPDANPTRPIVIPEEVTQHVEALTEDFSVDLEAPEIAISPGAYAPSKVIINNSSEKSQRYVVKVSGVPPEWVRIDRPTVDVGAGKSASVTISFKPLRRSDSVPGTYTAEIRVQPKDDPSSAITLTAPLRILPFAGFGVALEGRRLRMEDRFRVHLHNQGSAPLALSLTGSSVDDLPLNVSFSADKVTLTPGQRLVVTGQARPQRAALFGEAQTVDFDVVVKAQDQPRYTIGQRAHVLVQPRFPTWVAFAGLGIGVTVLAMLVLLVVVLTRSGSQPVTVELFDVRGDTVQQGDPLVVDWQVSNAESVSLLFQGIPVLESIRPDANTANISTDNLVAGVYTVSIQAWRGEEMTEASDTVTISAPLRVSFFSVTPSPIVRYVAQTMTLTWNVNGAVTTSIVGLDALTTAPVETTYGSVGTVTFSTVPTAPGYSLALTAVDAAGDTITEPITIEIIDPTCNNPLETTLYTAPRDDAQVISTVAAGTTVVVDARDSSASWLRVVGRGWGRAIEFACAQTFNVADLLIALDVPTAMPMTATPTITPTFTPTRFLSATPSPRISPAPTLLTQAAPTQDAFGAQIANPTAGSLPPVIISTATFTPALTPPPGTPAG